MKQYFRTQLNTLTYHFEQKAQTLFIVFACVFATSFITYMFFVVSSLSSGFSYQHIRKDIRSAETRIAQLEADRIMNMKAVDLSLAKEHGYQDIVPSRYISQKDTRERFSLRTGKVHEE
jgi:ABC-type lipoprotein release transport system permease subunit